MSLRFCLVVCLCIVAMFTLFAAPGFANNAETNESTITLRVALTAGRDPDRNVVQDYGDISWTTILAEEFKKLHPHVEVEFVKTHLDSVIVQIAGGIGPDIVNACCSRFRNFLVQGFLTDLMPLLAADGIDYMASKTFWEPQWKAFEHEGRQYALPDYLGTIAMYYNVDMFDAAGLARPDPNLATNTMTLDDFSDMAKRLSRDIDGDGDLDVYGFTKQLEDERMGYWLMTFGAEYYVDGDATKSALNSDEAMSALEYLQDLRWQHGILNPPGIGEVWEAGQVAIQEEGPWELVYRLGLTGDGSPKVPFNWDLFPMPIGPMGQRVTMATIDGYGINKQTQYPEEAYELLKFLSGATASSIKAKYLGLQPAHIEVVPEFVQLMQELNRDVGEINAHVFTDAGPYAYPQYLYSDQYTADVILNKAYDDIFIDQRPVRTVWPEAVERLNRILAGEVSE